MKMGSTIVAIVAVLCLYLQTSLGSFVTQEFDNGSYSVAVDGNVWLQSAPTFFRANRQVYSFEDGTLKLRGTRNVTGSDRAGDFSSYCYDTQAGDRLITGCVREYDRGPFVIFQQHYSNGASGTAAANGDVDNIIGGFPYFQVIKTGPELGFMSYGGSMFGASIKYGKFIPSHATLNYGITGGPLVLFDNKGNVIILSPFSQFMASSVYHNTMKDQFGWGVMGGVDKVPVDFTQETIMFYSDQGINKAMAEWGDTMRRYYQKDDSYRKTDLTLTHIGYWTDGGAYYYYNTEPGKTYEQTILDVWDYSKRVNLPYRFVQYDSFFYFKGQNGGVKTWSPMPDLFPDGFIGVYKKTGWPAGAHNRWWSPETTYAKQNGGEFEFIIDYEKGKAIPIEEAFWNFLFDTSREWGLTLYEQDWLDQEFAGLNATLTDIDLGRTWLLQMGRAAWNNGLTIQYCMSNPRHAMQSLEIPVVTQARVSGDYRAGADNWKIGPQSLFADAMGIAPFKDNFWSTRVQPGNPKYPNLQETHAELQAIVATLSTGPVAPGDMINATNVPMLMQCCNADGLLLKPSKPAMAINEQILQRAIGAVGPGRQGPDGEVSTTYTQIGNYSFGIIMAADMNATYMLTPYAAGFQRFSPTVVFSRLYDDIPPFVLPFGNVRFRLKLNAKCSKTSPCLYYTSPVFTIGSKRTWIYGEIHKFVPMSPQRVANINLLGDTDIRVTLQGAQGEKLEFLFLQDGHRGVRITCVMGSSGTAVVSLQMLSCRSF